MVAEIRQDICELRWAAPPEREYMLTEWLEELIEIGGKQIAPFDAEVTLKAGRLSDSAIAKGRHRVADFAIAAITIYHDLMLLTSNGTRSFRSE